MLDCVSWARVETLVSFYCPDTCVGVLAEQEFRSKVLSLVSIMPGYCRPLCLADYRFKCGFKL
jgi:hypothetical protein